MFIVHGSALPCRVVHGTVSHLHGPHTLVASHGFPASSQSWGSRGRLAQLGERGVRNAEVEGSSPLPSTNNPLYRRGFRRVVFVYGIGYVRLLVSRLLLTQNATRQDCLKEGLRGGSSFTTLRSRKPKTAAQKCPQTRVFLDPRCVQIGTPHLLNPQ